MSRHRLSTIRLVLAAVALAAVSDCAWASILCDLRAEGAAVGDVGVGMAAPDGCPRPADEPEFRQPGEPAGYLPMDGGCQGAGPTSGGVGAGLAVLTGDLIVPEAMVSRFRRFETCRFSQPILGGILRPPRV